MLTKRTFIHCSKHFQINHCTMIVVPTWELHEIVMKITRKINALSKTRSFQKNIVRESRTIKYALTNAA